MIRFFFLLIFPFTLISCGHFLKDKNDDTIKKSGETYLYRDPTGQYRLVKEVSFLKDKKLSYTSVKLFSDEEESKKDGKSLEDSSAVSKVSKLKLKDSEIKILNPYISQHTIWLDGKKYLSQIKADVDNKKLEVISTDEKTNSLKKEVVNLPQNGEVFCFFSQLEECVKITGFIGESKKRKTGVMSFYLIFDAYPFMIKNFLRDSSGPIVKATFQYDGAFQNQDIRYELKFNNEVVTYQFDKNNNLIKKNWVSQGVSQEKNYL